MLRYKGCLYREAADPTRDRAFRQQAEKAYKSLVDALQKGRVFFWSEQGYAVAGEYLTGGDYSDLVVILAEQQDGTQGIFAPIRRHSKFDYAIILYVIPDFWAEKTEEEQREMLPHLAFEPHFIHEFIHYLDRARRKAPISLTERQRRKQRQDLGTEAEEGQRLYFSNPEEFNAWFQAMVHQIEQSMKTFLRFPDLMEKVWLKDFPTFKARFVSHVLDYGWDVSMLDSKYTRKLDKRLYGLWRDLRREYAENT